MRETTNGSSTKWSREVPPVAATGLVKRFGTLKALDGLDLTLERGEIFGLIGPNGAGKTTTMRLLLDLLRPSGGSLEVLGRDPRAGGARLRRRIGYLPGELRLDSRLTGRELLGHLGMISGPLRRGRVEELAERLGADLAVPLRKLSKGNKQKVGLIQAFMHDPELLVLDEPTSGLDPLVQQEFLGLVREAAANGQTVLLSSHVLSEIEHAADRVGVLYGGRLLRMGPLADLRLARRRRVTARVAGDAPDLTTLPGLDATSEEGATLLQGVVEDVGPFVRALARHEVLDLTVAPPVLEDAVLELYRGAEGGADA